MTVYNLRTSDGAFVITKFDDDLNPEVHYNCTETTCECPAGIRPSCRHRIMVQRFEHRGFTDSEWFHRFESNGWERPLPELTCEPEELEPVAREPEALEATTMPAPGMQFLESSPTVQAPVLVRRRI